MNSSKIQKQNKQTATYSQTAIQVKSQMLPDASEMEHYEKLYPGITKEMVAITRQEQTHRHSMEIKRNSNIIRSQVFAVFALIIIAGLSAFAILKGYPTQGATIATSVIVAVVLAFLGLKNIKNAKGT